VLKPARYRRREHAVELGEIFLFVGTHFVVSVRHGKATELSGVRHAIEARPDLLRMGPSAVLHGILDHVVDDYRAATTDLEQQIEEEIEAEVLLPKSRCSPEDIYKLKREVLQFNTATAPLLEPLELLAHSKTPLIHPEIADYLRDVHDHLLKVVHDIHRFRELLANAMDLHLSSTSARLNARLGQLTLVASLFLPLTFLTGFFGMNFGYLVNHIGSQAAFGLGLLLMVASVVLQLLFFRRSGFLS
nr:hypothetical protein [Actinomycetota bacterium]